MTGIVALAAVVQFGDFELPSQTIITQTMDDWKAKSWQDFKWSLNSGDCPDGYEPIGVTWRGTKGYNNTKGYISVEVDEDNYRPTDFP